MLLCTLYIVVQAAFKFSRVTHLTAAVTTIIYYISYWFTTTIILKLNFPPIVLSSTPQQHFIKTLYTNFLTSSKYYTQHAF